MEPPSLVAGCGVLRPEPPSLPPAGGVSTAGATLREVFGETTPPSRFDQDGWCLVERFLSLPLERRP